MLVHNQGKVLQIMWLLDMMNGGVGAWNLGMIEFWHPKSRSTVYRDLQKLIALKLVTKVEREYRGKMASKYRLTKDGRNEAIKFLPYVPELSGLSPQERGQLI